MSNRVIVEEAPDVLDPNALLAKLPTDTCGAIVSFIGITRGIDNGKQVYSLEFDAWQSKLNPTLQRLGEEAIEKFGIEYAALAHRTGSVGPAEPIVAIHVSSKHRKEAFQACSWLIDELKAQAPIWKKEVREDGEEWKAGLG
ncbi:MAG: hypothetical protein CMB73_01920 [Euryarchaeota archaeon]|nr:hypothetical protein [Euryarchaeota archaeon]|tara:strand:+ start:4956 stop:5381 length:426 start_codon:yes stop_codon:yes gene_type:complete